MLVVALFLSSIGLGDERKEQAITGADAGPLAVAPEDKARDELLKRNKFAIAGPEYKQIFEAYIGLHRKKELPVFITSDSILNGFHVLYEESIARLEQTNAAVLRRGLASAWEQLQHGSKVVGGNPDLVLAARVRARTVIGTALVLSGGVAETNDKALAAMIKAEVAKVNAAVGPAAVEWAKDGAREAQVQIDYSRMKPRGFYTRSPRLSAYFRATAYLQSVPFFQDNDQDLVAAVLICESFQTTKKEGLFEKESPDLLTRFDVLFDKLVGPAADSRVSEINRVLERSNLNLDGDGLATFRNEMTLLSVGAPPLVRDLPQGDPESPRVSFRVLPARLVPESPMFQATTDPREFPGRTMPSGLEICVALSRTSHAIDLGREKNWPAVVDRIHESHMDLAMEDSPSVYRRYLAVLATLNAEPEKDAPRFLLSDAWKTKQIQTTLAGWAQLRHTWQLQAKESMSLFSAVEHSTGFVEPVPEFYANLGELAAATKELLTEAGALGIDLDATEENLQKAIAGVEKSRDAKGVPQWKAIDDDTKGRVNWYCVERHWMPEDFDDAIWPKLAAGCLVEWKLQLKKVQAGEQPDEPTRNTFAGSSEDIAELWDTLIETCKTLELLSHKQLRGAEFKKRDTGFIEHYGETLAKIMFYDGNAYLAPQDDAPRTADVHSDPRGGQVLEVGIGRPRAIYVLYPWKGEEILCRGAVLPYYEFPSKERLTDEQWRKTLDSEPTPQQPEWLKRINVEKP
jgi:hypothetical protein